MRIHFRLGEGREGSGPARALRIGNGSRPCPPAPGRNLPRCSPVPSTPQRGGGQAGPSPSGSSRSPRKYGGGSLGPAEAPLGWGGGNGEEGYGPPLSRTPPPQFRLDCCCPEPARNCHSPPPSAPAVSASSSHSFLQPPPRRAARVPYVMASRPLGAAAGGPGTLSFACPRSPRARRDRSAWEPRDPERGHPARAWRGADSGPACLPGPQDFAPSRLSYGAGVSSKDGWGCL